MSRSSSSTRPTPTRSYRRMRAGAIRAGSRESGLRTRLERASYACSITIPTTTMRSWTRSRPRLRRRDRARSLRPRECSSIFDRPLSSTRAFRHALNLSQFRPVLGNGGVQTRDVLHQALGGQPQEVVAELRILEVELEQPVVCDGEHLAILEAFDGSGPAVFRIDEAKLAHDASGRKLDPNFFH